MKKQFTGLIGAFFALVLLLTTTSGVQAQEYCEVSSNNTSDDWLSNVTFAGIDNDSESTNYSDFTDLVGSVSVGETYTFEAEVLTNGPWNQFVTVWIDFDQNGEFNNEDERFDIGNCTGPTPCSYSGDITIPAATPGITTMRVIENYNGYAIDACTVSTFSEIEDYGILIDGDCTPVDFSFEEVDDCEAFTYEVFATLTDFAGNTFVTINMTRSDEVVVNPVTVIIGLQGQTISVIQDVPFGVTVSASIEGANPDCNLTRNWSEEGLCPPANNECDIAQTIECGETFTGSTLNGSTPPEGLEFCSSTFVGSAANAPAVWYAWTAPYDAAVTFSVLSVNYDSQHFAYSGSCEELICIDGHDSPFNNIEFNAVEGQTYYFMMSGWGTSTGDFEASLNCVEIECEFPGITATPVDADGNAIEDCVPFGDPVRVEVTLTGGAGNDNFLVTVGDSSKTMVAPETHIFGTYTPGQTINVSWAGNLDSNCDDATTVSTTVCPAENDNCEDAIAAECGGVYGGTTIGATSIEGQEYCGTSAPSTDNGGVWYVLTLDGTNDVDIDLSGSDYDTKLFLYSGECGALSCVAGNDDGGTGVDSRIQATLGEGTYYIYVTGFSSNRGVYTMAINCVPILCDIPEVTVIPVDENDVAIEDCQLFGETYRAAVTINGGEGNSSFTVSIGDSSVVMTAGETHIFGVYTAGSTQNISIVGNDDELCNTSATVSTAICPAENDNCEDAFVAECGGIYGGTTVGATAVEGQEYCVTSAPSADNGGVWYVFTLTGITDVDIDLSGSEYDTKIFLYSGECGALTCVTGNDDGGTGVDSRIQTQLDPGTYYIYVSGFSSNRGIYTMSFNCVDISCSPTVTATAVNEDESPIEDCVDQAGSYWVLVQLEGGAGEDFYNASVNGGEPVQIAAEGSGLVGPVGATEEANVVVTGVINSACSGTASTSVDPCPPSNDLPCDAIALPTDGTVMTYTNIDATADEGEVTPGGGNCASAWCEGGVDNSVWFSFVAPPSGRINATLCGPGSVGHDTQIAIYSATDCGDYGTFGLVAANDDLGFANCEFGSFLSGTGACVTPGEMYYIQVDGYFGTEGPFDISITEEDGAICDCVLPNLDGLEFFATTDPVCDGENENFSMTLYAPEDLGSQEGMLYIYDWAGNPGEPIEVLVSGDPVTVPELFPLGTVVNITVTISDQICEELEGSPYPIFGGVVQDEFACDPDCEGVDGGDAQPGTPCTIDEQDGTWNNDCECIPNAVNDDPCDAIAVACDDVIEGNTAGANPSGLIASCAGGSNQDVFYTLDAVPGTDYTITVNGDNYDGVLSLLTGDCDGELTEFACADNGFTTGVEEVIEFTVDEPTTVLIRTYNWNTADPVDFTLTIDCEVANEANIEGTVAWNADCGDRAIAVNFYNVGTADMVASYNGTVAADGSFSIPGVQVGTFDVISKVDGYLAIGTTGFIFDNGPNLLNLGTIQAGDLNGDNGVNISDFSVFNGAFNTSEGDPNFNALADMNCDGGVSIVDFSILNGGFNLSGAEAPLE